MDRAELQRLHDGVDNYESFGRAIARTILSAALKTDQLEGSDELTFDAKVILRQLADPKGGHVLVGCICVTEEGCPCVPIGDILIPSIP
jgi:hypothetical protein